VNKNLKKGDISVDFNVNLVKKASAATVQVLFSGESILLSKLLWQFKEERTLDCFENPNTHIFNCATGFNNIVFSCPDVKVFASLLILYQFILKHKLNPLHTKTINTKNDTYDKLYSTIKSFKVIVTGKCKSTYNAVNGNTPKFNAFGDFLNTLHKKFNNKQKLKVNEKYSPLPKCTLTLNKSPGNQVLFGLYLSILLGDTPCKVNISGTNVELTFVNPDDCWSTINKSTFKNKIKAFLSQYGAIGSEPDDADKKSKYKIKSKTILESLTISSEIFCNLHSLKPFKFDNANDARIVNGDIVALIKSAKISCE